MSSDPGLLRRNTQRHEEQVGTIPLDPRQDPFFLFRPKVPVVGPHDAQARIPSGEDPGRLLRHTWGCSQEEHGITFLCAQSTEAFHKLHTWDPFRDMTPKEAGRPDNTNPIWDNEGSIAKDLPEAGILIGP